MQQGSASSRPIWHMPQPTARAFPCLDANASADVVVVGGGISGLTTAYLLLKSGRAVKVLESGEIASGESGRTTAHLSNALDDTFVRLEKLFGDVGSKLAAQSHGAAIDMIERIVKEEGIDCDFARVDGFLFLDPSSASQDLYEELKAAHMAGLIGVRRLSSSGTQGFETNECLVFPGQGQFHVIKYLYGLVAAIRKMGGEIYTGSHVTKVVGGEEVLVHVATNAEVRAKAVVMATNTPINDRVVMHTKQAAYRTYAVAALVPKGSITKALYWDMGDPYHYIRLQELQDTAGTPPCDLLIVGGEDHKTGQGDPEESMGNLVAWTRSQFPMMQGIGFRWSGQVMEPVDCLGFAGINPLDKKNVYIITGDSGHGITHGTLGAMIVSDLIAGKLNPWAQLYDPGRVTIRPSSAKEFLKENANVAAEYADLATGGDVSGVEDIKPGTGAVIRRGLHKIAVYKDAKGKTHSHSALCPHLRCVVQWNNLEASWDCPCHGSRFDVSGKLLNGPANNDLDPAPE